MKKNKFIPLVLGAFIVVLVVGYALSFFKRQTELQIDDSSEYYSKNKPVSSKRIEFSRGQGYSKNKNSRKLKISRQIEKDDENPYENVSDEEMATLTKEQCKMLDSLRNAFNEENKTEVIKIVQCIQKTKGWEDLTPKIIREEAIEALGWFGIDTLSEVVGFLSDSDDEILSKAIECFEDVVEDTDLQESQRANILVMAAQVIRDPDALESMFFELNNMHNTTAVAAIKELWKNANETARKLLPEVVESITGEDNIDTPEKLDAWLRENPDDEE